MVGTNRLFSTSKWRPRDLARQYFLADILKKARPAWLLRLAAKGSSFSSVNVHEVLVSAAKTFPGLIAWEFFLSCKVYLPSMHYLFISIELVCGKRMISLQQPYIEPYKENTFSILFLWITLHPLCFLSPKLDSALQVVPDREEFTAMELVKALEREKLCKFSDGGTSRQRLEMAIGQNWLQILFGDEKSFAR